SRAWQEGYRQFDFGRTGDDNPGLAEFKSRWGARRLDLHYYYLPETEGISLMRQNHKLKNLMDHTVRNAPLILNRLGGNLLYRFLI
ncbi:MAG: hypothetical protein ACQERN_13675, partial [Thermodesulfobacteriota bacterium]